MSELRLLLHKEESGVFVPVLNSDFFQNHTHSFSSLTGKPTTLAGYGITNAATSGHSHAFSSITSKPTSLAGYGITDAASISHSHTFSSLTFKPTTLAGYGIGDAAKLNSNNVFTGEQEFQNNSVFSGHITIDGAIFSFDTGTTFIYATGIAATHRAALGLGTLATQSGTFSGTSSGNNTGDQTITLTGIVTGSGTGSFTTSIANNALSIAKTSGLQTALDAKASIASLGTAAFLNTGTIIGTIPILGVDGSLITTANGAVLNTQGTNSHISTQGDTSHISTFGEGSEIFTYGKNSPIYTSSSSSHILTEDPTSYIQTRSTFKISDGIYTTTLSGTQTANRAISFPNGDGTLALLSDTIFATGTLGFDSSPKELTAARIKRWDVSWVVSGGTRKIRLPYTGVIKGDIVVLTVTAPSATTVQIEAYNLGPGWSVIETLTTGQSLTKTWVYDGFNWKDLDYWLGVPSVISGSVATTGTATTTFAVSIGRTLADTNYRVSVTPLNSLSSPVNYVSSKTTTGFNVVYLVGLTGAVAFDWMVVPVVS